ncbi:MAG: primase protein [candidate division TM6 bacterium GW2011_GWF2_37_49]|nr:MAG: primase protein [candidate division TM6 bacterium GW2011_GWF2_37_49]
MSSLFDFLKSQLSIVDVVSGYVQIRPIGLYLKGSCPFHSEKDASFTVSPDKQIFYCFGCHASGDAISFIAKIENLNQLQAAKFLIERYRIELPQELQKSKNFVSENTEEKYAYFAVCKAFALWANQQLLNDKIALGYIKSRGINDESINSFLIGYFPGGVNKINRFLKDMAHEGILLKDLLDSGILHEGRSNIYSPFEERILFPIKDSTNRFCGFGGRIFKAGDDRPKYYNSRESDGFIKGKLLFAFDSAKKSMHEKGVGFLVEGYLDCIMMAQFGYKNTVATLGTACTIDHLKQLSRYIKALYVLYDGDKAGQNAILRLAEFCWEAKLDLHVIQLPAEDDPASLLQNGYNMELFIQKSLDIFNFFINSLGANFQQKALSEKMFLAEKIIGVIAKIGDSFKRDLLLSQASMVMNLPFDSLKSLLDRQKQKKAHVDQYLSQSYEAKDQFENLTSDNTDASLLTSELDGYSADSDLNLLEEKIFSAILDSELKMRGNVRLDEYLLPYFSENFQKLLKKLYVFIKNCGESQGSKSLFLRFLDRLELDEKNFVIKLSVKHCADLSKEAFDQLVFKFCKINWKFILHGIKDEMAKAKEMNNPTRLNDLLIKFLKLKEGMQSRGLI